MKYLTTFAFLFLTLVLGMAQDQEKKYSHADYFAHYEGTATCLQCHQKDGENFFHSQHYQWQGAAPQIINAKNRRLGKLNTINDFCTSPRGNWIGLVKNSRGDTISRGCSACHAGLGKLPTEKISDEQLQNIDCLICHANGYRRDLFATPEGGLAWQPILWKNREGLDAVAKRITLPTRATCLRCHNASGGGVNFKRGDLEYKLVDCGRDFDVHMASEGKNMQCISCHAGDGHRVRGRGTDLSGSDMPSQPLRCDSSGCHSATPHQSVALNHHTKRVNCTVCHIPSFARAEATDMARDWSQPVYHADTDRYTAKITLQTNVQPVYAWFNGFTKAQLPGEPVARLANGSVGIMVPQGSRLDRKAQIFAFKLHQGRMPMLAEKNWLIPIMVEQFFPNGKIEPAIKEAAKEMYKIDDAQFSWVNTSRYMGIFHGVPPAAKALNCLDCHSPNGRMDWKALGYPGDPLNVLLKSRAKK
ncbi:MAG: hypothetical protein HY231_12060 [Acidobacteria bacterium]|nr:hypothetical protein [Acidobacteriota bacterium]